MFVIASLNNTLLLRVRDVSSRTRSTQRVGTQYANILSLDSQISLKIRNLYLETH